MENMTKAELFQRKGSLKAKLMAALSLLLVSTIMLGSATFAWFTLSTAPEVTGLSTTVGSNGSLEIALQSTIPASEGDMTGARNTEISSAVGDSRYADGGSWTEANITWGNIVTLIDGENDPYGFSELRLYPALLNYSEGVVPIGSPLVGPKYGVDGRVTTVDNALAPRFYDENQDGFIDALSGDAWQYFGVKGVGQYADASGDGDGGETIAYADYATELLGRVSTYRSSAQSAIANSVTSNLVAISTMDSTATYYTETEVGGLQNMISGMQSAVGTARRALGVEYLVTMLDNDVDQATILSTVGLDAANTPTKVQIRNAYEALDLATLAGLTGAYADIGAAATTLQTISGNLTTASTNLEGAYVEGSGYTASEVNSILNGVLRRSEMYINETDKYSGVSSLGGASALYIVSGCGTVSSFAQVVGDFSFTVSYLGASIPAYVTTGATPAGYDAAANIGSIQTISNALAAAEYNDESSISYIKGGGDGTTYGYEVDLAFRSSAAGALLLQGAGVARVSGQTDENIIGQGSTVSFAYGGLDQDSAKTVAKAIRVAFVNTDTGALYGIGKVDNATIEGGSATGTLVMYSYDGTALTAKDAPTIIDTMTANQVYWVTAIVYMDGEAMGDVNLDDLNQSVSLNLQFATNADLDPMDYSDWVGGANAAPSPSPTPEEPEEP